MAISGIHVLLYSTEADELRAVLRDVFQWDHVDVGGGWLIFGGPPAELAVHPSDRPAHQLTLMCDDLAATMEELSGRGVVFRGDPSDEGFGITATMVLPGEVEVMLYEPRHETMI